MAVITIREQGQTDSGFNATLVIDGNNYNITVSDPFAPKEEQELEWYFEDWLCYPMLDNVKADRAKESVKQYGEELFKQVFQKYPNAYAKYSQLRNNLNRVKIEIESISPEFHAIHWEALQDPDLPRPLAIDLVLIRKNVKPAVIEVGVKESPTVNLLVVTARPNADEDVGYRTISRPLVEAIRNSKLRVNMDLLRPGTYKALENHLEEKGSGYYHIVHFDVHGSLINYEDFQRYQEEVAQQKEIEHNPYVFNDRYGRGKIAKYDGLKAFLSLEGKTKGEHDLVEASEIANLLTGKGIPVCILNACQSGKQLNQADAADNRETSLGSRLMNAGMQMVFAMSYSVTVSAAEIIMTQIYTHLFAQQDIYQAIRFGRRELYNSKGRRAYYNTEIDLEDWLLPVTYCNGKVDFKLRKFTPEEEEEYYLKLDSKYEFQKPIYGFVGRDLDILLIEKALLKHNILLLRGMGGTGKTTLLNYLREWWQVTNFAEDIFYVGYDEKAWTLQQIVFNIGQKIYNRFEFATFQAQNLTVQWRKLSDKLRTESYILILDNLESVTGQPLAIQNTLDESAREEIRKFLAALVGGKTKVVLGSRIGEDWLRETTFRDNIYRLKGLDAQARTDLAENILQKVDGSKFLDEIKTDQHFDRLMKLLAGYPLAMEVVLVNLKQQSPSEILEQLETAEIDAGGEDRTNNIIKCIDYSHSNLSASAQNLLLLLAPFRGFICSFFLPQYVKELGKLETFQDYELERLEAAVTEAVNWGLLSPIDKNDPQLLTVQPILPYFLTTKLKKANAATREALQEGFKNHYRALAVYYHNFMESNNPQERQMGIAFVRWEYENLYKALQISLQKEEALDIFFCLNQYFVLIKDVKSNLKLVEFVTQAQAKYNSEILVGTRGLESIMVLDRLALCYLRTKNHPQAEKAYLEIINLLEKLTDVDNRQIESFKANTYHQLGRVAQDLRKYEEAQQYFLKALEIQIEHDDRFYQATTYEGLGDVAKELREYEEARQYYLKALSIYVQDRNRFKQGSIYNDLGLVTEKLQGYEQARQYYLQALPISLEFGDHFSQASIYHNLGRIAGQMREYEQARQHYLKALEIKIKYSNRLHQATTYQGLGDVSQELCEYEQAQKYYLQAMSIYYQYGEHFSRARILHGLGNIAIELREYNKAQNHYRQALNIYVEYGDHYEQAKIYHQLGIVAQKIRKYQQANDYYQKALSIKIKDRDRYEQAGTYGQLGMLAEELSEFEQAKSYYLQSLGIFVEFEDQQRGNFVMSKLSSLYQKTQDNSLLSEVAAMLNMTEAEVKELFENVEE